MPSAPELRGQYRILPMDKVIFGRGSVAQLPAEVEQLGKKRALIITGTTLATKTDLVQRLKDLLGDRYGGVFSGTRPHVPRQTVLKAAQQARQVGADIVISFGGSTPVVTAKGAALAVAEGITERQQLDQYKVRVELPDRVEVPPMTRPPMPHIAITTTLSGGEFTNAAGITDEVRLVKEHYVNDLLTPKVVILDPELTTATPDWLWASTGIKALDHAIEALYSKRRQPLTDALSLKAIGMLFEALPRCDQDPTDLAARGRCQVAAWLSIFGFVNASVGLSHGIGHQLGAHCGVPHGYTSCVTLPHAMEFNGPATADTQALIAQAAGVDTRGMSPAEAAAAAAEAVRHLIQSLHLPQRLRDVGVQQEDFAAIADGVMHDMVVTTNPRPVTGPEEVIALLHKAW